MSKLLNLLGLMTIKEHKKRLKEVVAISSLAIDLAISLIQSDDGKQSDKISGDAEESKSKKSKKTKKSVEGK